VATDSQARRTARYVTWPTSERRRTGKLSLWAIARQEPSVPNEADDFNEGGHGWPVVAGAALARVKRSG